MQKTPQTLLWACISQRETNHNSCLDESIIDSCCTRWYQTNLFTCRMTPKNMYVRLIAFTARSTDLVCTDTCAHRCSFYLWWSCCDRPQGSISVSHFCSCVQTVPSTRVHQGRLKTITTTWLWKITDTSISAVKKGHGNKCSIKSPREPEDVERAASLHRAATVSFRL